MGCGTLTCRWVYAGEMNAHWIARNPKAFIEIKRSPCTKTFDLERGMRRGCKVAKLAALRILVRD